MYFFKAILCVFTIIFPSANQLHCIYLTMISMNTEYNFPPYVKRDMFFPAKKPGIYIFQLPLLLGWDQPEAATNTIIRCGGPFDPDLPGHHCLDLGTVDIKSRRNHLKNRLVGRKWLYLNVFKNMSRSILNFGAQEFSATPVCVLNQTKDVGPTHDMCHGLLRIVHGTIRQQIVSWGGKVV